VPSGKPFYLRSNKRKELQGNRQTLAWKANLETEIAVADMFVGAAAKPAQCWRVISSALSPGSPPDPNEDKDNDEFRGVARRESPAGSPEVAGRQSILCCGPEPGGAHSPARHCKRRYCAALRRW
jgi:hypothetical protein